MHKCHIVDQCDTKIDFIIECTSVAYIFGPVVLVNILKTI